MVMSLRSGAVDMSNHLTASQIADLSELSILEGGSNIIQALYLNNDFEPFRDLRVRQALCYAIDRQAVIDLASDGHGIPVGSSMIPSMGKYVVPELLEVYKPDAEKAKALLKEAGYENLSFSITVPSNYPAHVDAAQVIVEQLRAAGINAEINLVEWAAWLDGVYKGRQFESTVVGMDTHSLAASGCLARFQSESGKNFINFNSPEYDAAYAKALATVDEAEQTELFKECERILTNEAANVYLQDSASFAVMQKDVAGYQFYPALYIMDLSTMYRIK
jgi:peptide/nickel transport system substrate-binding protein